MVKNVSRTGSLYSFVASGNVAGFDFGGIKPNISIDIAALTPEIKEALMLHGLKQKVIDAGAIGRDPETGKSPSPEERIDAMKAVADRLVAGVWKVTGEGGGSAGGLLKRALTELYPEKDITAWLEKLDDKQKAALRTNPKVAPIIERLKAKTGVSAGIDSDDLLSQLDEPAPKSKK